MSQLLEIARRVNANTPIDTTAAIVFIRTDLLVATI
jgi:hypothetical protein